MQVEFCIDTILPTPESTHRLPRYPRARKAQHITRLQLRILSGVRKRLFDHVMQRHFRLP
ncbi:hypothetical protein BJI67_07385 [Acidihalobacter aeolianus]|uniref:Uncharacterized protein n=1 Tax=Acidihalobacter aeolianus TaxID=2792603 RepID=A0A1D8K7J3_9GAMM|nr:hypothetical protein BJI67_07385 [Acidihalobacter aeolianus]